MTERKKLIVGNWKMHGSKAFTEALLRELKVLGPWAADVAVCPPALYLPQCEQLLAGSAIAWGAQDVSAHNGQGAYTGEISATMLKDFGARYAIVGHSERRTYHAENDQHVAAKAKAVLAQDLIPIVCVGETRAEREAGHTEAVVQRQLGTLIRNLGARIGEVVVAYEPVWAIGTGLTASPEQAQAVHERLRQQLLAATPAAAQMRILYGGSVKPDNAASLFAQPDIDGGLIGGAALKAADFDAICRA
jgi:triosephosphate isomerase (TIM)